MTPYFRIFLGIILIPILLLAVHCSAQAQRQRMSPDELQSHYQRFLAQVDTQQQKPAVVHVPTVRTQVPPVFGNEIRSSRDEHTTFTVTLVLLNQERVRDKCVSLGAWGGQRPTTRHPVGCAVYDTVTRQGTIYASRPTSLNDEETLVLGHELWHIVAGQYHAH